MKISSEHHEGWRWALSKTTEKARFSVQPRELPTIDERTDAPTAGVIFEIQVVLKDMLLARSALDGHAAYEQFRNLSECAVAVGGFDAELQEAMSPTTSVAHLWRGASVERQVSRGASMDDETWLQASGTSVEEAILLKTENEQLRSQNMELRARCAALEQPQ